MPGGWTVVIPDRVADSPEMPLLFDWCRLGPSTPL